MNDVKLSEAQRVALDGLDANRGRMVVTLELDGPPEKLQQSAAALMCLKQCLDDGLVKHTLIAEASGLFEMTPKGRFVLEMSRHVSGGSNGE